MESTAAPNDNKAAGFRVRRVVVEPPAEAQGGGSQPGASAEQCQAAPRPVGVAQVDRETRRLFVGLVGVLLEVLDGVRPLAPLATRGLVAPQVARYLRAAMQTGRARRSSRLQSVHVCAPRPGAVEIAAVCRIRDAIRAVALRAEQDEDPRGGRQWRVVAVRII